MQTFVMGFTYFTWNDPSDEARPHSPKFTRMLSLIAFETLNWVTMTGSSPTRSLLGSKKTSTTMYLFLNPTMIVLYLAYNTPNLSDQSNYHVAVFSDDEAQLMIKMLSWPLEYVPPVLDAYRLLMVHAGAVDKLGSNPRVRAALFQHAKDPISLYLVLRALANWVAKRSKASSERNRPAVVPKDISDYLLEALDKFADATSHQNKNVVEAYVLFVHNIITWFSRLEIQESDFFMIIYSALFEILAEKQKEKILFYALLTLGTMAYNNKHLRDTIRDGYDEQLVSLIRDAKASNNRAIQQVGSDLHKVFLKDGPKNYQV